MFPQLSSGMKNEYVANRRNRYFNCSFCCGKGMGANASKKQYWNSHRCCSFDFQRTGDGRTGKRQAMNAGTKLTRKEIEAAINVSREEYPQNMPCAVCGYRWMQHMGTLCPATPGGFATIDGQPAVIMPVFQEETTFLPDVAYYSQNPDFDVV